ncbi:TolC family outer membrane protein [Quisquiliibacterium transsilvanicum]|uniref:Outer membrane protein/protease secretion system outer membrane protein n=1 Tax=Quisquiliibacterium transsilvanicum TaxID=1549638 RepID=A0A7W8HHD9_9BURK|nr:TolC family outer membrane protein [Quisquiliibacterium transsilvanicum]MBB5272045.1 outer membrane protein/protease secretion system outer membrane protein [Quisquiliibacterium transsilvanicum]
MHCTLRGVRALLAMLALALPGAASGTSLQQAFLRALEHDAGLRASRAGLESSRERVPQARAQLLPQVQASWGRNFNDLTTTSTASAGPAARAESSYYSYSASLSVRQPLFNLQRYRNLQQANSLVVEAESGFEKARADLLVRLAGAYMEALFAREQLRFALSQREQLRVVLDAARKALAAGSGTRTDVDDAQARLDQALADELDARQALDFSDRQLHLLTGQPASELPALRPQALARLPVDTSPLEQWIAQAQRVNPEVHALQARLEAAQREVDKARASHAPTLEAVLQWSDSANDNVVSLNRRFENRAVGVQLVVPLYQGGAVQSQVRQALAELERATETLEDRRRQIALEVHREHRGVTGGESRIRALEQAVRSAQTQVQSTRQSRKAGVRTVLDELDAEQRLSRLERDLAQARYLYLMSSVRLQTLAGREPLEVVADVSRIFD